MTDKISIDTVLVANRGEIAVRVIRTLREMGIRSVAVFSEPDRHARHVAEADTAVLLGPAAARESYLAIDKVIDAATRTGAQAIHPGYGFLSENAEFATACTRAGIAFLGPDAHAIEVMGDKITAKNAVAEFGVPIVPGIAEPGLTDDRLIAAASDIGYPILVKPSAGGGGKGMRLVENPDDLPAALRSARREAASSFGDDTLFIERFVLRPRHIEVQILADRHGNVVHLGERECSLQRRHQKVIEEAPSPLLDEAARARIGEAACNTARSVDYVGAGTVEFIVSADAPDEFFFMEMNTRLQVEHPVTEMVTGLDLVEWQVRVAAGEELGFGQDDITLTGHAIEARVYAEDPSRGFLPTGGTVADVAEPSGPGVRVDSGLQPGTIVGSDYDPMLAKVIAHADDRASALRKLDRALAETGVLGIVTNIDFARFLLADPDVVRGDLDTGLLDRRVDDFVPPDASDLDIVAVAAFLWLRRWPADTSGDPWDRPTGWRMGGPARTTVALSASGREVHVHITGDPENARVQIDDADPVLLSASLHRNIVTANVGGQRSSHRVAEVDGTIWSAGADGTIAVREIDERGIREDDAQEGDADVVSPMPGTVIEVGTTTGSEVTAGQTLVVVEAMKMEHALTAPIDGVVDILVTAGEQVRVDQPLARVSPHGAADCGEDLLAT
ncbi:acetyl/propionyl/methylcrotonyl-CoA carboxylase subunit alpha [Rhodococcus sp. BP-349]|uniref:acetyl/propionyl/methylcrotonyl-CoA carboxylase subunit alpha n=1 Tax=unclassified Rhodococcus (in: high G+C Gram-positive bacteria) TaxID=192944 RepID=UPI001C9B9654|nr:MULTISPECIES: acetyl/propionyl/methylcrotonyl-CoA carboxylase subunit alpha [unclassified Rhodococcus (in: high G+C Gram-positive bacteria)]MBY6537912.1 acetyl/propionyl/methylcrotonyl-CoA carboxylase subunit alpha [Rhodococcus sp. BP-363]MBY6542249.1 acetyl/propionyl/methylcrotonyl-CoA carboxylase subunit alpha [Rhodococcus sp. BP-369]MBY6561479.1 acetyl/propionyl/methylcrotonyl-CoA carboxylase subunit alpha [Rhodococcus sp. BP-370]MBY6575771.1 acetyl/propionyl/methylcrotonyl-CoA carboxylas